jgi:hypothetical protein
MGEAESRAHRAKVNDEELTGVRCQRRSWLASSQSDRKGDEGIKNHKSQATNFKQIPIFNIQ